MSNVSITKASKLTGISRTTLYTDMNSGKLSFKPEGKNRRTVNVAELERVYGSLKIGGIVGTGRITVGEIRGTLLIGLQSVDVQPLRRIAGDARQLSISTMKGSSSWGPAMAKALSLNSKLRPEC